jgi:hypothetical protein
LVFWVCDVFSFKTSTIISDKSEIFPMFEINFTLWAPM